MKKLITRLILVMGMLLVAGAVLGQTALAGSGKSFQSALTAVAGQGSGTIEGTFTSEDQGTGAIQGTVNVRGTSPETLFTIERWWDFHAVTNGVCAPPPVVKPPVLGTFTTSAGGAGAEHFEAHPPLPSGTTIDVRFQVTGGANLFTSDCFTVTVQ